MASAVMKCGALRGVYPCDEPYVARAKAVPGKCRCWASCLLAGACKVIDSNSPWPHRKRALRDSKRGSAPSGEAATQRSCPSRRRRLLLVSAAVGRRSGRTSLRWWNGSQMGAPRDPQCDCRPPHRRCPGRRPCWTAY
eukprot:scaffold1900_cov389-Prasinococcus_capsulatus_cf.AAC.23